MFLIVLLFACIAAVLTQTDIRSNFAIFREECIQELKLGVDMFHPHPPMHFDISPNLQQHNRQCLDRCIFIKSGIINENETLQEEKIKQLFPRINNITAINQSCPIISNLTDKCEKAFVIGQCIQFQNMRNDRHFKPRPPHIPPHQWQKYRNECTNEIAKGLNTSNSTSYEITTGLQGEWCLRRCMLIKRGILDESNVIQVDNVKKYVFGDDQIDINKCTSIKNENKCREAEDIYLCINILMQR